MAPGERGPALPCGAAGLFALFITFLRLGATAFGGPAMIPRIAEVCVKQKTWLSAADFKNGVAMAQIVPGATAMQVAAYVGLRAAGSPGSAMAFLGFGLPAFLLMLALSWAYQKTSALPVGEVVFQGFGAIVIGLVAHGAVSIGRSWIKCWQEAGIAGAVCLYYLFGFTPYLAVPLAGIAGVFLLKNRPAEPVSPAPPLTASGPWATALGVLAAAAAGVVLLALAARPVLAALALTMARIDLFAFGGGFGSLPIMAHEVVQVKQWLDARTFLDGIALGQVTPGPIVITATFVGWMTAGLAGAMVATIAIFLPSFLMVLVSAPVIERLRQSPMIGAALRGVSASATGMVAALACRLGLAQRWGYVPVCLTLLVFTALILKKDPVRVTLAAVALSVVLAGAGTILR
jgi:chromate transporter